MSSELTVDEQKVLVELQIRREVSRHLHLRIRPESADRTSQDFGMNITFAPPYIDDPRGGSGYFSMAMLLPINSFLVHEPYLYDPCERSDDIRLLDASLDSLKKILDILQSDRLHHNASFSPGDDDKWKVFEELDSARECRAARRAGHRYLTDNFTRAP